MYEPYKSQQAAIITKAKNIGINVDTVEGFFDQRLVEISKADPTRSVDWRLARAELLTWTFFFPEEQFPGVTDPASGPSSPFPKIPHGTRNGYSALQSASGSPRRAGLPAAPGSHREASNRAWIHERYHTQESVRLYPPASSSATRYNNSSYRHRQENKASPHLSSSVDRLSGSLGKLPATTGHYERNKLSAVPNGKRQVYQPGEGSRRPVPQHKTSHSIGSGAGEIRDLVKSELSKPSTMLPPRGTSQIGSAMFNDILSGGNATASRKPNQTTLEIYQGMESEKLMENKAIREDKRRDFFIYLGMMRHYSRTEHEKCDARVRGWFADALTWQRFFQEETYPYLQPDNINVDCKACSILPRLAEVTSDVLRKIREKMGTNTGSIVNKTILESSLQNSGPTTPVNSTAPSSPVMPAAPMARRIPSAPRAAIAPPSKAPMGAPRNPSYKPRAESMDIAPEDEKLLTSYFGSVQKDKIVALYRKVLSKQAPLPAVPDVTTLDFSVIGARGRIHTDIRRIFKRRLETEFLASSDSITVYDEAKKARFTDSRAVKTGESIEGRRGPSPIKLIPERIFVLSPDDERILVEYFGAPFKEQILVFHKKLLANPGKSLAPTGFILSEHISKASHYDLIQLDVGRIFEERLGIEFVDGKVRVFPSGLRYTGSDNMNTHKSEPEPSMDTSQTTEPVSGPLTVPKARSTSESSGSRLPSTGVATTASQSVPPSSELDEQMLVAPNQIDPTVYQDPAPDISVLPEIVQNAQPAASGDKHGQQRDNLPQSPAPHDMLAALSSMRRKNPYLLRGTVVMFNLAAKIYPRTFIGLLFESFASDTKHAIATVGEELRCNIKYHMVDMDLLLWTKAYDPNDRISRDRGHLFLQGWISRTFSFGMALPSEHWAAIRQPLAPFDRSSLQSLVDNQATYNSSSMRDSQDKTNTGTAIQKAIQASSITTVADDAILGEDAALGRERDSDDQAASQIIGIQSPFEDPEFQWERYKTKFHSSDVDRLLVEETAKTEGDLRMVADKHTDQVVSVEELVKRTVYRCRAIEKIGGSTSKTPMASRKRSMAGQGVVENIGGARDEPGDAPEALSKKRKAEDEAEAPRESERDEKRACI